MLLLAQCVSSYSPGVFVFLINFDPGVDDGDRVRITEQTYGALLVTTIRGLCEAGQLNENTIPDLELSLMAMAHSAEALSDDFDTCYHVVLKGYGKRLFDTRTNEERERAKEAQSKAFEAFVKELRKKDREKKGYAVEGSQGCEDNDGDDDGDEEEAEAGKKKSSKPWFGKAKATDSNEEHATFRHTAMWRKYKAYVRVISIFGHFF